MHMKQNTGIIVGIIALVLIVGGVYMSKNKTEDSMTNDKVENVPATKTSNTEDSKNSMMAMGSYEVYAPEKIAIASETHDVVLFFRASWCPTCRTLDADIKAHLSEIPANLTILDVNYDDSAALKQKYSVTYQHTFVQVDANGDLIKKWSGSPSLAELVAQVK